MQSGDQSFDDMIGHYSFSIDNVTDHLIGNYYENDTATGEISNELDVAVEFESDITGTFSTGEGPADVTPLFKFNFEVQENGMATSHGEWLGATPGYYQFVVGQWDRFIITVYPKDGESTDAIVFTGRKIPEVVEKTFFQKYGTMMMIGVFFFMQMFVSNKTRQSMAQQQAAATAGASNAPIAQTEHATVEEITDDSSNKKDD
jgi:hypothetical protein